MTRIHLNDLQRALLGAIADVIDECGTASLAMAAERIGQNPDGLRGASEVLLKHGLIGRIKPTITLLGAGWNALGRMPRSRLSGAQAEPEAAAPPADPPSLTDRLRELVPRLPRPATTRVIAEQLDAYEPSVGATLGKLARKGEIARYTSDGPTLYGPLERTEPSGTVDLPGVSSAGTDPAGDAGPGVVEPLPVADDQAPEGSACGDHDASRPMEAGGVGGALEGAPVEGLGGGAGAAADASASEGRPLVTFLDMVKRRAAERIGAATNDVIDRGRYFEVAGPRGLLLTVDPHHSVAAERGAVECNVDVDNNHAEAIDRALAGLEAAHAWQPPPVPTREEETLDLDLIVYEAPKVDRRLRVYVATGLEHAGRARLAHQVLRALGHEITYDWTTHGSVQGEGTDRLREVALFEMDGVVKADLVIAILPGGRGTHVEIGAAIGAGVPVLILEQVGAYGAECAFYSHPAAARRMWETVSDLARHVADGPAWAASVGRMTAEVRLLRLELEEHVGALDEIRATLTDVGITPTAVTDTGSTTTLSTPTMTHMAAHELRRTRGESDAAMAALKRLAAAAGLPDGVELKARDVDELVEHITERLAEDPPSGTTVRTVLDAVAGASEFLLDWHADDAPMVAQLPRLLEHLRRLATNAAIVEHAERHGDSAQELVASLPALIELLLEYDVEVTETAAPGGPIVHAVRRALSVSQDRGVALATTDGVVGELLARCQDYAELAGELRAAASRVPSLAAAAADLDARIAVIRGAAAIVQAEVASA